MEDSHYSPTLKRHVFILLALILSKANPCLCTDSWGNALTTQAHLTVTNLPPPPMNGAKGVAISQRYSTSKSRVESTSTPEQIVRRSPAAPTEGAKSLGGVVSELRSILVQDTQPTKSTQDCDPNVCIVVVGVSRHLLLRRLYTHEEQEAQIFYSPTTSQNTACLSTITDLTSAATLGMPM